MVDSDAPGALFFAGHAAEDAVVIADELLKQILLLLKEVLLHQLNFCKTNSTNQRSHLSCRHSNCKSKSKM